MAKVGRPTKYEGEATCKTVQKLAEIGNTVEQIAQFLEVDQDTIYEWRDKHPEFSEILKNARDFCDELVEQSLYARARGMKRKTVIIDSDGTTTEKTEDVPPDATSMIFWLKNRKRELWKDRQDIEHSGSVDIAPAISIKVPEKKT